jgi:hypothetical protein
MILVYIKCSYELIALPGFFKKLKDFVGHFRIEAQGIKDSYDGIITISFYTDKVEIPEGKEAQVELVAQSSGLTVELNGSLSDDWHFSSIGTF